MIESFAPLAFHPSTVRVILGCPCRQFCTRYLAPFPSLVLRRVSKVFFFLDSSVTARVFVAAFSVDSK